MGWDRGEAPPLGGGAGAGQRGVTEAELRSPHVPDSVSSWCEGGSSVGDCPLFDRGVVRGRDQMCSSSQAKLLTWWSRCASGEKRGGGF